MPQGSNNNDDYYFQINAWDENEIGSRPYKSAAYFDSDLLATASGENEYLEVVGGGEEATVASFVRQIPELINISTTNTTLSINPN